MTNIELCRSIMIDTLSEAMEHIKSGHYDLRNNMDVHFLVEPGQPVIKNVVISVYYPKPAPVDSVQADQAVHEALAVPR